MTATRGGTGGERPKGDPALPDREGLMNGTAGTNGRGVERRVQKTGSRPAPAGQPPKVKPTQVVVKREGVHRLAERCERGHDQLPAVHARQADDLAGPDWQEQLVPVLQRDAQGVPQVPQEMAHLPGPLPQGDSAEETGEPLQGELPGKEGWRTDCVAKKPWLDAGGCWTPSTAGPHSMRRI
jgi:hypothetical protein